jgi:hypothetical protein
MRLGLIVTTVVFFGLSNIENVIKDGRGHGASHTGFRG